MNEEIHKSKYITREDASGILDRTIDFVKNCDNKAGICLGIFGIILTIVLTTDGVESIKTIFKKATEQLTFCYFSYLVLFSLSMLIVLFGMFNILKVLDAKVVFLREEPLEIDSKIFFQSISQNATYQLYKEKLFNMSEEDLINDISSEIYINACICKDKYIKYKRGLKWSSIGFLAFFSLWIMGLIIF